MKLPIVFSTILAIVASTAANAITIDVDKCVAMAIETSEQVKAARNTTEQAKLRQGVARTAYLPNFDGSVTTGWSLPDQKYPEMGMTLKMRGIYMAGINLTQPIYAGGKIIAANRMASIGRQAAADQMSLTIDQVTANAETTYWTYVAVLAKVEMMKSYMKLIDTIHSQTLASVKAGMATNNDLLRIEARRSQVVYQLEQVENGADLCRMALCNTIGVDHSTPITPADTDIPVDIPTDLDSYNLDNRPEIKLLNSDIAIKQQQVNLTRGDFLPSLGLQAGWMAYGNIKLNTMMQDAEGNYHQMSQNIKDNNFSIMLGLKVPLFHWGEGVKKVKAAKIDVANSRLKLDENRRLMNLEVQQAITNVRTGRRMLDAAETAMAQAETSLASTTQSYEVGLNSLTDMLDAQSQWQTSRANLIEARTQLRINIVDYLRATAKLTR